MKLITYVVNFYYSKVRFEKETLGNYNKSPKRLESSLEINIGTLKTDRFKLTQVNY